MCNIDGMYDMELLFVFSPNSSLPMSIYFVFP